MKLIRAVHRIPTYTSSSSSSTKNCTAADAFGNLEPRADDVKSSSNRVEVLRVALRSPRSPLSSNRHANSTSLVPSHSSFRVASGVRR